MPTTSSQEAAAEFRYTGVAVGPDYTCALQTDGKVFCVGTDEDRVSPATVPAPEGRFKSITAGESHACGIQTDGTVACWGSDELGGEVIGLTDSPEGKFTSVSAGAFHTCGVRTDSTLTCWGLNRLDGEYVGLADPPDGAFTSVSVGWLHTCALEASGTAVCWGHKDFEAGQSYPPSMAFESVSTGGLLSCGLSLDGELVCWGAIAVGPGGDCTFFCSPEMASAQEVELPTIPFHLLPDGGSASCGITSDASIMCWGWPLDRVEPPQGDFADVSVGGSHACGLRTDGAIVCWTLEFNGEVAGAETGLFCVADRAGFVTCPGEAEFELQAMAQSGRTIDWQWYSRDGIDFHCGHRLDDSLACWVDDHTSFFDPVPTAVEAFATSDGDSVCWLLPDRTVACWGTVGSPTGTFRSISLGGSHEQFGCGIRTDNTMACWGHDTSGGGRLHPPAGQYKSVSASRGHACAIGMDDTVDCWGNVRGGGSCWGADPEDYQGCLEHMEAGDPWSPLSGTFKTISGSHCGVHTEGHIECEIGDDERRWWKIDGAFQSVGVGSWGGQYACGLYQDRKVECWGDDAHRRASPPDGEFESISIGAQHACGVRADGTAECWGGEDTYIGGGREAVLPAAGSFRSVSVGGRPNNGTHYGCGIRTDGSPACWGNPSSALLRALAVDESAATN